MHPTAQLRAFSLIVWSTNAKIIIYQCAILLPDLYGWETCSLTFRKEHRLQGILEQDAAGMSGSMRYELTAGCRKLHNEKLHLITTAKYRTLAGHMA
jgi:hypothetical protein